MGWQWHQVEHMQIICISLQTDNHASTPSLKFLQARCLSWRPTNSAKALKAPPPQHNTTILWPFFRDHPDEPVPEENFWTLWCKGRLTEADTDHPDGRHSIRTKQCPPPSCPFFYRLDALPAAQPTVLKHWRQTKKIMTTAENRNYIRSEQNKAQLW